MLSQHFWLFDELRYHGGRKGSAGVPLGVRPDKRETNTGDSRRDPVYVIMLVK